MTSVACCAGGQPQIAGYQAQGTFIEVGGLKTYVVGSGSSAIVALSDIFGFHCNQIFQLCDRLAAQGFVVAAPDVFNDKPWPLDKFPPKPEDDFMGWIHSIGAYEKVAPMVESVAEFLQTTRSVSKIGTIGFCWGAMITTKLTATGKYLATAAAHPSYFGKEKEIAACIGCPIVLLATPGDPCEVVKEEVDKTPYAAKSVFQRFDDMPHGFLAARGDFSLPRTIEAMDILIAFFKSNLH